MGKIVTGPKGPAVLIEPGDSCYSIAEDLTGDPDRWPELVDANPGRALSELGTFRDMIPGERLACPVTWIEYAKSKGIEPSPDVAGFEHIARERAAAGEVVSLPLFWTMQDVKIANAMGEVFGGNGDDVLVTFYQETAGSMNPHVRTDFGETAPDGRRAYEYGGLIGGLGSKWENGKRVYPLDQTMGWPPGTWLEIVKNKSLSVQLQAIAQIWDWVFKTYIKGETIGDRARRLEVPLHAMIHALNFLPARIGGLKTAEDAITKSTDKDPGTRTGSFYGDNIIFDVNKDGKITLRDMANFGDTQMQAMMNGSKGTLLVAARSDRIVSPIGSLAVLWGPITGEWQDLTGKPPVTSVGYSTSRGFVNISLLIAIAVLLGVVWYVWKKA